MLSLKYLRRPLNRVQSKNHKIETCKMNKISLPNFDDKIYILDNVFKALSLGS